MHRCLSIPKSRVFCPSTGAEAEGWLIAVGGTPREIAGGTALSSPTSVRCRFCMAAEKMGAWDMRLGVHQSRGDAAGYGR